MKRSTFDIKASDGQTAKRFAWNSALDEATSMARRRAGNEGTYYRRLPMTGVVGDRYDKIAGVCHWVGDNGGKLDIAIIKEPENV